MKTTTLLLVAAAAGGYSLYWKNKTNQWPWETGVSGLLGYEKWTVTVYPSTSVTASNVYTASSGNEARTIAQQAKAQCPTCRVVGAGPGGQGFEQLAAVGA